MGIQTINELHARIDELNDKLQTCKEVHDYNIKQFEMAYKENYRQGRNETLREVLDALYEGETDELCITQAQYERWEKEVL